MLPLDAPDLRAQTPFDDHYRIVYVAPFVSAPILGSQDKRSGIYAGVQWARPEKRLTLNHRRIALVIETGVGYSYGGGWQNRPRDETFSIHMLGLARYEIRGDSGRGSYFEIGWGLNLATQNTFDLDSTLNSTPALGFGVFLGDRMIGIRFYHISNAGTVGSNQGQNQICLFAGLRF